MKKLPVILFGFFLYSCNHAPIKTQASPPPRVAPAPSAPEESNEAVLENIDVDGLKTFLKMNRKFDRLGFVEKKFNTCEVGYGYSSTHNCRTKTFVVLQFQLMCRDSEGTVTEALTPQDLRAISNQSVKWTMKNLAGRIITDSEGYGQIVTLSNQSQRYERLKLSVRNDFLYMKAGELTQMVTPQSWCN